MNKIYNRFENTVKKGLISLFIMIGDINYDFLWYGMMSKSLISNSPDKTESIQLFSSGYPWLGHRPSSLSRKAQTTLSLAISSSLSGGAPSSSQASRDIIFPACPGVASDELQNGLLYRVIVNLTKIKLKCRSSVW